MPEVQLWEYELLKSAVAAKQISIGELEYYKAWFKDEIQSTRSYACIKTLDDLLDCLEKRDALSEYNIEPLRTIAENFDDDEVKMALDKFVPTSKPKEWQNVYAMERLQEKNFKAELKQKQPNQQEQHDQKPTVIINFTQKKRDDIYKLIARDIGREWRSFGRGLLIRAGELDAIDSKHPKDLQSKVYEMLEIFENDPRHNPRDHYETICEALERCRRKDIRRQVQNIMRY